MPSRSTIVHDHAAAIQFCSNKIDESSIPDWNLKSLMLFRQDFFFNKIERGAITKSTAVNYIR